MSKRYMTSSENERQKIMRRIESRDDRFIREVYPNVEKIEIEYSVVYRSPLVPRADGPNVRTVVYRAGDRNVFEVDCSNGECTEGYFNLEHEVWNMVRSGVVESQGKMCCKGKEAHDHLYQSCGGRLEYIIRITYKEL